MVLEGSLDLFELMVNYLAGSIWLSIFIWALILLIAGIMGRLSMETLLIILITFLAVAGMGYFGSLFAFPLLFVSIIYAVWGIINAINSAR